MTQNNITKEETNEQNKEKKSAHKATKTVFYYLNPGQPRTLLQLQLVGILTINLFLTQYTTSIIKTKKHPLKHLLF
jgi:hypothetical protein